MLLLGDNTLASRVIPAPDSRFDVTLDPLGLDSTPLFVLEFVLAFSCFCFTFALDLLHLPPFFLPFVVGDNRDMGHFEVDALGPLIGDELDTGLSSHFGVVTLMQVKGV